ncbi:ANL family adenylate-forming protein, partial [Nocardia bovistercoris]
REVFGPVLIQVYGTTETGVLTMLAPHDHDRAHTRTTVGRPLDPDALSIRHPDTGTPLPTGETGEICAIPRWPIAGYWHDPHATTALRRHGWTRTGDLGYLDTHGYLHLAGRLADMMKVKGIRIHPETIEKALAQAPGVSQAAVFGVEDTDRVEHIHAAVVAKPDTVLDLARLRRHIADTLSDNHVPTTIDIRAELPV